MMTEQVTDRDEIVRKDEMGLETITPEGKAPKHRLDDAGSAVNMVQDMIYASLIRNNQKALAQGQRDGNRPYDPGKRRKNGQDHLANVNTMEADGFASQAVTPYYDLFDSAAYPVCPILDNFGGPKDRTAFQNIMGEELGVLFKCWPGWHMNWWPALNEFIWHGRCFFQYPNPEVWTFNMVPEDKVLFPENTTVDPDDWEVFATLQDIPPYKLWEPIADGPAPKWNREAVIEAIRSACPKNLTGNEPMDTQRFINEKSFLFSMARSVVVQIANIYVKEWNGKWSHLITLQPAVQQTQNPTGVAETVGNQRYNKATKFTKRPLEEFLYEGYEQYDSIEQVISTFLFDATHTSINECYGMAKKTYPMFALNDRLFCAGADGAFLRLGFTVQGQTEEAFQKLKMVRLGAVNYLPPGLAIQQSTIMADIDSGIKARQDIATILQTNTGVYKAQTEQKPGNPKTASEYMGEQQKAQVLANSAVGRFYTQLDVHFTEVGRRVILCSTKDDKGRPYELAREWRKRCIERNVPEEAFDHVLRWEAVRTSGNGSIYMRQQIMGAILQVLPRLPEDGQEQVIEDYIAAWAGQSKVERYDSRASRKQLPTQDHDIAMLENAAMRVGAPVTWEPSQNDVIHAQVHLQSGAEAAQSVQQGANPKDVSAYIHRIGAHTLVHLQNLEKDPTRKEVLQILTEQWKQLAKFSDGLEKRIQQQDMESQQNQKAAQDLDAKTKLKAFETQAKLRITQDKWATQKAIKLDQHRMKLAQQQQDMAMKDASTAADIHRKSLVAFNNPAEKN